MPSPTSELALLFTRAAARVRVAIARHPIVYWGVVAAVAGGIAVAVQQRLGEVDAARASWGEARHVMVATRVVEPGEPLDDRAVEPRLLPVAAIPEAALASLDPGAVAQHQLGPDEVVLAHHVAPGTGLASRLPVGTAGVAVPTAASALALAPGDLVDVVSIDDPLGTSGGPAGLVLAAGATVLSTTDDGAVISVDAGVAPATAAALAGGRAVLVLVRSVAVAAG